jgi:hypothetical protein
MPRVLTCISRQRRAFADLHVSTNVTRDSRSFRSRISPYYRSGACDTSFTDELQERVTPCPFGRRVLFGRTPKGRRPGVHTMVNEWLVNRRELSGSDQAKPQVIVFGERKTGPESTSTQENVSAKHA